MNKKESQSRDEINGIESSGLGAVVDEGSAAVTLTDEDQNPPVVVGSSAPMLPSVPSVPMVRE